MEMKILIDVCPFKETANKKREEKTKIARREAPKTTKATSDFKFSRTFAGVAGNYGVDTARGVSARDRFLFANRCKCFKQLQDARQIFARGLQGFSSLHKELEKAESKGKKKLDAGLQKRLEVSADLGAGREGTGLKGREY